MLDKTIESQLLQEYSKIVVGEIAPDELPFFDELFINRNKAKITDPMLGSGIDQVVELLSPAIIAAMSSVLTYTFREILRNLEKKNKDVIKQEIGTLFKEGSAPKQSLTAEQLRVIRTTAQKQLQDFGWDDKRARRAANAIIGALSVKNASKKS